LLSLFCRHLIAALSLVAISTSAHAAMRCATDLVEEGETSIEVIRKCGAPASREVTEPVIDANGTQRYKSVTVEQWVYGPNNGMYRYLRFIDGKLVQIRSERR